MRYRFTRMSDRRLKTVFIACLLVAVLFSTGCVGPAVWYAPHGRGVVQGSYSTLNIKDCLRINLETNIFLEVHAHPDGEDTLLSWALKVPDDSWAQYSTNTIKVTRSDNGQALSIVVEQMDTRLAFDQKMRDRFSNLPMGKIFLSWGTTIKRYRPKEFVLETPAVTVDGKSFTIPPIRFTVTRGIGFYRELL